MHKTTRTPITPRRRLEIVLVPWIGPEEIADLYGKGITKAREIRDLISKERDCEELKDGKVPTALVLKKLGITKQELKDAVEDAKILGIQ